MSGIQAHRFEADGTIEFPWKRGPGVFAADGDFGSGTLTLKFKEKNHDTFVTVDAVDGAFTADNRHGFTLGEGIVQIDLSGATAPDLKASFSGASSPNA